VRVCLLTEGTYPYVRGGVSTWCHDLVVGLPEFEFVVYAMIGNPSGRYEYALPPNVTQVLSVPLWGHERLDEYNGAHLGGSRRARSAAALRAQFLPLFETFLAQVMRGVEYAEPAVLAETIGAMYAYFREHDYDWTMRREETWKLAMDAFMREPWHARHMSSLEAIELVRSLYRYLIPLAIELPRADLYHTSVAGLCGIAAVAAKQVAGMPVILTEHGVYLRERVLALARAGLPFSDRAVKKNFFSGIARATYAVADVIAPVCAYNTTWEHFYGVPPERIRVIYNGVDEHRFDDRDLSPERPTVAAVLRIDPLKDVPTMIASAATVRAAIPDVEYKLWGPAPDPGYLAECERLIVELDLSKTVTLMGPTRDPAAAYADSHVVALSSISEGFPFSIIEAMMCAKPIVATDVGGVREAVDRFGTVVPPKRPERMGEAIVALLRDPLAARELGKGARAFALEHFTQTAFLAKYRALYDEVAALRPVVPA
jgi:glycosyltransferase involved in cell wall biosynthesis